MICSSNGYKKHIRERAFFFDKKVVKKEDNMKNLKEAFVKLVKAVKEKSGEYIKDDMKSIDLAMTSFCSYVDAVYRVNQPQP